ncbi:MAG: hypothetical protein ACYS3N_18495 [Planctomycetota bacterium]|jgi:hypothetical protein
MKNKILYLILSCLTIVQFSCSEAQQEVQQDVKRNCEFLKLILTKFGKGGRYIVVEPKTGFGDTIDLNDKEEIKQIKKIVKKNLVIPKYNISSLLDALFEINRESVTIETESDVKQGYLIDRKKQFDDYFEENGGGWEKLYQENPNVKGFTTVSIPAYDKDNSILLVYEGTQSHWLAGVGWIIAYKVEKNELIELSRVKLWIS